MLHYFTIFRYIRLGEWGDTGKTRRLLIYFRKEKWRQRQAGTKKGKNMSESKMFQVSTLQALMLGYSRSVITVSELLEHGDTGIGTFEDVDGEMIVIDGICYRATENGSVVSSAAS